MCPSEEADWEWTDEEDPSPPQNTQSHQEIVPYVGSTTPSAPVSRDCEVGSSRFAMVSYFIGMGFQAELVTRAVEENDDMESVLDSLLTYSAVEKSPHSEKVSSQSEEEFSFSDEDMDTFSDEENAGYLLEKDEKLSHLVEMGFFADDASAAIERCGLDASIFELADSIHAACMAEEKDEEDEAKDDSHREGKKKAKPRRDGIRDSSTPICSSLPNPMVGFGLPSDLHRILHRELPKMAIGPPYFYFENVALAPKGAWEEMSRNLYGIEPEFVDSQHFCAAARKRGYIHNLPIDRRTPLLPVPPMNIQEALPAVRKWWPSWDKRTKLNCILSCTATARLTERIRSKIATADGDPCPQVQRFILEECRRWNLVWVGLHKVAPLEPDEVEMLLGFPKNHTRGGGISRTERFHTLGNSFQVDTVAYHLSVLQDLFPHGMRVLSLFSGIGGAEVAMHRLGIRLNVVVSVEKSEASRNIVKAWWAQTEQTGTLIHIDDVKQLDEGRLEELILQYGGFDLIIGGSPCNNLSGSNRVSRNGLEGQHSSLFYDYCRILHFVRHFNRS